MEREKCDEEHESSGAICNQEKGHKGLHMDISPLTKRIYYVGRTWR